MGESHIELARKALELAERAGQESARLFRESSGMSSGGSVTVAVEEAVKAAQWASRRAQLAAQEATTRANLALTIAFESTPVGRQDAETALKSAHHARWLLRAAEEAVQRAQRLREELEAATLEAARWSDDAEDTDDRLTLVQRGDKQKASERALDSTED